MENKKNTKILLISLMVVLFVATIVIVGTVVFMNATEENPGGQRLNQNKVNTIGGDIQRDEKETEELVLSFLKLENNEENKGKNKIYSPLSIKYGLYLLRDGADGSTLEQIEKLAGTKTDVKKYENIKDKLSFANAVYIRDSYKDNVKNDYIENVKARYDAEINYDSFKSADNVNSWIEEKTFGQIKELLKDYQVTNSNLILINALAIDMKWKNQFDTDNTQGKAFFLNDGSKMQATTLYQTISSEDVSYFKDDEVTALSMDLEDIGDNKLSFIAIMPNEEGLDKYIDKFELKDLYNVEKSLVTTSKESAGVNIFIPKFNYDYELDFKNDLIELGLKDVFEGNANFSKMTNTSIYFDEAIHKANIEFKEEGTKAAAVTVFATKNAIAEQPETVEINKPFLYFIKDRESGEIWFVGALYEPNDWAIEKADYRK